MGQEESNVIVHVDSHARKRCLLWRSSKTSSGRGELCQINEIGQVACANRGGISFQIWHAFLSRGPACPVMSEMPMIGARGL